MFLRSSFKPEKVQVAGGWLKKSGKCKTRTGAARPCFVHKPSAGVPSRTAVWFSRWATSWQALAPSRGRLRSGGMDDLPGGYAFLDLQTRETDQVEVTEAYQPVF